MMPEYEGGTPKTPAAATPGTPTPFLTSVRIDSVSSDRNSVPRCKCSALDAATPGSAQTRLTDSPAPDISLARKVIAGQLAMHVFPSGLLLPLCLA